MAINVTIPSPEHTISRDNLGEGVLYFDGDGDLGFRLGDRWIYTHGTRNTLYTIHLAEVAEPFTLAPEGTKIEVVNE